MTTIYKHPLPAAVLDLYANRPEGPSGELLMFGSSIEHMSNEELKALLWFGAEKDRRERAERIASYQTGGRHSGTHQRPTSKPTLWQTIKRHFGA